MCPKYAFLGIVGYLCVDDAFFGASVAPASGWKVSIRWWATIMGRWLLGDEDSTVSVKCQYRRIGEIPLVCYYTTARIMNGLHAEPWEQMGGRSIEYSVSMELMADLLHPRVCLEPATFSHRRYQLPPLDPTRGTEDKLQ